MALLLLINIGLAFNEMASLRERDIACFLYLFIVSAA